MIHLVVSSRPRCPPIGELCHVRRISHLRVSSGGMVSLSFCWSFHQSSDGVVIWYVTPCDSCCSMSGQYHCWVLTMASSRELGESSFRTRMKDVSGIIVTS